MRFTQAATDFYKNVRKEAEATGAIPKPKPKPKPKTQRNVAEFELNGQKFAIEWDGVGDDADVARIVNGVKAQVAYEADSGDNKYRGSSGPVPQSKGTPKKQPAAQPKQPAKGPSLLDVVANPLTQGAPLAARLMQGMGGGATEAAATMAEDIGRGANFAKQGAKATNLQGFIPSKLIGSVFGGGDPEQVQAFTAGAESFDPIPQLGNIAQLANQIAGDMRSIRDKGKLTAEGEAIYQSIRKNPVEGLLPLLTGLDKNTVLAAAGGDMKAADKVRASVAAGILSGAVGLGGALVKGVKGAAAAGNVVKAGANALNAEEAAAILGKVVAKAPEGGEFRKVPTFDLPEVKPKPTSVLDEVLGNDKATFTPKEDPNYDAGELPDLLGIAKTQDGGKRRRDIDLKVVSRSAKDARADWEAYAASRQTWNRPDKIIAFHGTNAEFDSFDPAMINSREAMGDYIGDGFFFHKDKSVASRYGKNIKQVELRLENPLVINTERDAQAWRDSFGGDSKFFELTPKQIREEAKRRGYDGLVDNLYGQYAVFDANQIKGAPAPAKPSVLDEVLGAPAAKPFESSRFGDEAKSSYTWEFKDTPGEYRAGVYTRVGGGVKGDLRTSGEILDTGGPDKEHIVNKLRYVGEVPGDGTLVTAHTTSNPSAVVEMLARNELMGDRGDDLGFGFYAGSPQMWGGRGTEQVPLVLRGKLLNMDDMAFGDRLGKSEIKQLVDRGVYGGFVTARGGPPQLVIWDNRLIENLDDLAAKYGKQNTPENATVRPAETISPTGAGVETGTTPRVFYHGTTFENANAIKREGFAVGKGESPYLGGPLVDGVHLSDDPKMYGNGGTLEQMDELLTVQADLGNVYAVGIGDLGKIGDTPAARAAWLKSNGYDSIRVDYPDGTREFIVIDPKRARVESPAATATPETVTPTTPTSARQADINADREALGKAGFSTDEVRKWSELEAKANPNAVPKDESGYKAGAWTDQETVNATAKLRELKSQIEALRKSGDDPETLVTLEDEFDQLTEAMYRSGTEQGRALASRRYTMDVDMSADGLRARYKARAAKNGTKVDPKRLQELEAIAKSYEELQAKIDSGELVKARKRSSGPAKTREELAAELSKMWDEFSAKDANTVEEFFAGGVETAINFTGERLAMIGKMAVKAVELGVATVDELVEQVARQFVQRGLEPPDRATILSAWRTEREAGKRAVSEEVKAARAQRAKLEAEIKAELDAPAKAKAAQDRAEAQAKKAAEAADRKAKAAAERQAQVEANAKARADEKARARAEKAAAEAEAKALREEQERILSERAGWDRRNKDRQRELDRLNTRIAELEQSIEAGTGEAPKTRKPAKEDVEIERLRARQTMLQSQARAIYASTQPKKAADVAVGAINVPRSLKASIDISAPGRQGWILSIANPKAAGRAFADQMRALATEEGAVMAQNQIMNRPNVDLYKRADLYLAPVDGALNAKEEAFLGSEMFSKWKKFNPVRASDRAYAAYLNRIRADVFDNMAKALGPNATDEQLREIARYINIASGRGDIGMKGSSEIGKQIARGMPAAALGFWSPRNMLSRIQFVTGVPLATAAKVPGARKLIAKEYAKSIIATGSVIGLAKLGLEATGQGSVSGDITSSDFGKIRAGDTRIDVMAGVQQPLVLLGRLMTGKTTSPVSGKSTDLHNPKFGQPGPGELVYKFAESKANPILGSAKELYTGKDFVGQPVGKGEAIANVFVPLSAKEIYDALTEEGIDKQDALVLLNIFGISTARFKGKEKQQN